MLIVVAIYFKMFHGLSVSWSAKCFQSCTLHSVIHICTYLFRHIYMESSQTLGGHLPINLNEKKRKSSELPTMVLILRNGLAFTINLLGFNLCGLGFGKVLVIARWKENTLSP